MIYGTILKFLMIYINELFGKKDGRTAPRVVASDTFRRGAGETSYEICNTTAVLK